MDVETEVRDDTSWILRIKTENIETIRYVIDKDSKYVMVNPYDLLNISGASADTFEGAVKLAIDSVPKN